MSILHVCGGDPNVVGHIHTAISYSPRMWRWSRQSQTNQTFDRVFSTYVEVILLSRKIFYLKQCILHVCGGDPRGDACQLSWWVYSPRMWRWSSWKLSNLLTKIVFSTYVEVILSCKLTTSYLCGILHVCGGDPNIHAIAYEEMMVFSTYVEVLLYWDSWRNHECNYTRPQGKILKSQASKKQKEIFR